MGPDEVITPDHLLSWIGIDPPSQANIGLTPDSREFIRQMLDGSLDDVRKEVVGFFVATSRAWRDLYYELLREKMTSSQ